MDTKKTGAFIAELRKEKTLTQTELAKRLNISNRTVSKWENGDGYPDITMLPELASALGVSVDELLQGERKREEEASEAAEAIFDISFTDSAANQRAGQITFASRQIPFSTAMTVSAAMLLAATLVNNALAKQPLVLFNYIFAAIGVILVLNIISILSVGALHINALKRKNGGRDYTSQVVFSDKIYCRDGVMSEEYPLESITGFYIGEKVYVIKIYKRLILNLPKSAFDGRKEEFEAYMRSISPSTVNVKKSKLFRLFDTVLVVFCILSIILGDFRAYVTNDMFFYRDTDAKAAFFYDYENEFNKAVEKVKADKEIAESIKKDGYAWSEEHLVSLERIGESRITDKAITFDCINTEGDYYNGYLYYDGEGTPWITSLVVFDDNEVDKKPHYIKSDDLYLYGKEKNGSLSRNDWFLLKKLADKWYYFEYHSTY